MKGLTDLFLKPYVMVSPLSRGECMERVANQFPRGIDYFSSNKLRVGPFSRVSRTQPTQGWYDANGLHILSPDSDTRWGGGNYYVTSRNFNVEFIDAGDHTRITCSSMFSVQPFIVGAVMIFFSTFLVVDSPSYILWDFGIYLLMFIALMLLVLCRYAVQRFSWDRNYLRFMETTFQAKRAAGRDKVARPA